MREYCVILTRLLRVLAAGMRAGPDGGELSGRPASSDCNLASKSSPSSSESSPTGRAAMFFREAAASGSVMSK